MTKLQILRALTRKGSHIITIEAITEQKFKIPITSKFYNRKIFKRARVNCILNANYENMVNNARIKENKDPDFVSGALPYGEWNPSNIFIEHNGNIYLRIIIKKVIEHHFFDEDNNIIPDRYLKKYMRHNYSEKQNLDNQVQVRNYNIKNISSITIDRQKILRGSENEIILTGQDYSKKTSRYKKMVGHI